MTRYILRRTLQALPVLGLISIAVFALMQFIPGGPLAVYANNPAVSAADLARLQEDLGLNVPAYQQYLNWLGNVLRGDWGISLVSRRPALTEIMERLPNTLFLSLTAFFIALGIAIPIGTLSAVKPYSRFDHLMTTLAFIGHAIPVFWLGLLLIILFNVTLKNPVTGGPLLPGGGMSTIGADFSLPDRFLHWILPASVLILNRLSAQVRYTRAGLLDVLNQDYIRAARAKGLRERAVMTRHAVKNGILPLVTLIGLEIPSLFNGALLTETIFSWPGMGRLFFTSLERADYPVLMGVFMLSAALVLLCGLLTDVAYAALDPRIRFD